MEHEVTKVILEDHFVEQGFIELEMDHKNGDGCTTKVSVIIPGDEVDVSFKFMGNAERVLLAGLFKRASEVLESNSCYER